MLRLLVVLLVLANGGYFVWAHGFLRDWGLAPSSPSEPQRIRQQIRPDVLRILPASEARGDGAAAALASARTECLLAGPIEDPQLAGVKQALAAWPAGSWTLEPVMRPASWLIYMGKYDDAGQLARKKAELRERSVDFDPVRDPALAPGLSLGRFATEAEAGARLQVLAGNGVRSARVVQQRSETGAHQLQLPAVDESLRPRLESLRPVLNAIKLRPCRPPGDKNP